MIPSRHWYAKCTVGLALRGGTMRSRSIACVPHRATWAPALALFTEINKAVFPTTSQSQSVSTTRNCDAGFKPRKSTRSFNRTNNFCQYDSFNTATARKNQLLLRLLRHSTRIPSRSYDAKFKPESIRETNNFSNREQLSNCEGPSRRTSERYPRDDRNLAGPM